MEHIKKFWWAYLLGVVVLILIAYQLKWFGNTTTLFHFGGTVPGGGIPAPIPINPVIVTPIVNQKLANPVIGGGACQENCNARYSKIIKGCKSDACVIQANYELKKCLSNC